MGNLTFIGPGEEGHSETNVFPALPHHVEISAFAPKPTLPFRVPTDISA